MRKTYLILSFIILPFFASSAVMPGQTITGCAKYFTNIYDEVRCIRCNFGMGLRTQSNTCQFCKAGQTVVNLVCVKSNTTTTTNLSLSSSDNKSNSSSDSKSSNTTQKSLQNEQNKPKATNTSKPVSNEVEIAPLKIQSSENKTSFSGNKVDFFSTGGENNQSSVDSEYNVSNCFKYSTENLICLVCQPNYTLTKTNECVPNSNFQQNYKNNGIVYAQVNQENISYVAETTMINLNKALIESSSEKAINTSSNNSFLSNTSKQSKNASSQVQKSESQQTQQTPSKIVETKSNLTKGITNLSSIAVVHKYPKFPFCFDYDGSRCWACVSGYLLNLIINQCIPYVKPPDLLASNDNSQNANKSNENLVSNTGAPENCNLFNEEQNVCEECFRNYFLNKKTQLCEAVNKLCRTYDPDTGDCLTCYVKYSLASDGKCKLVR